MNRKRAEAIADRRNQTADEVAPSSLPLSPEETEEIRQAYEGGCRGEIVIGFRGRARVVTMLIPVPRGTRVAEEQDARAAERLRVMRCDSSLRVSRSIPVQPKCF